MYVPYAWHTIKCVSVSGSLTLARSLSPRARSLTIMAVVQFKLVVLGPRNPNFFLLVVGPTHIIAPVAVIGRAIMIWREIAQDYV
jgi:hypothetical protein